VDRGGYAVIPTIFTIRIIDPLRNLSTREMTWPFSSVRLLTKVIPELKTDNQTGAFIDAVTEKPVLLSYEATDLEGQAIRFEMPVMVFGKTNKTEFDIVLRQQRVGFAPPTKPDNTRFETDRLTILVNLSDFDDIRVKSALIRHPALQHFRTDAASETIEVTPAGAPGDALGNIVGSPSINAAGGVGKTDLNTARYGAFAAPDIQPHTLSKSLGAAGRALDDLSNATKAIQDLLGNTKILGLFSLADLLASELKQLKGADDVRNWIAANGPAITNALADQSSTISVSLKATPPNGATEFSTTFSAALLSAKLAVNALTFNSTIVVALANPQESTTSATCVLTTPTITLGFGTSDPKPHILEIQLEDMQFQSSSGSKPSFTTGFKHFQFLGDLAFLNGIMAALPSNLFSNPPQLVIDAEHAEVDCSVGLPSFGFGVFSFSNLGLDTSAVIRFDGKPADTKSGSDATLAFTFNFSTPDKPFSIVVSFLEGQGSFGMTVTPSGVFVDASLAFGGGFELDLKVIKGGVAITAGIHLHKRPDTLEVTGFLHLSGGVEVLGLIAITVDAMMSLSWDGSAFTGTVELRVTVDLMFFHKSVSVTFTKTFAGQSAGAGQSALGTPEPVAFIPPGSGAVGAWGHAWAAYCAGFAA
jgi:hypothetical protein